MCLAALGRSPQENLTFLMCILRLLFKINVDYLFDNFQKAALCATKPLSVLKQSSKAAFHPTELPLTAKTFSKAGGLRHLAAFGGYRMLKSTVIV